MPSVSVTGQTLVSNALTKLTINELGATPSASDSTSALNELNNMWGSWGIDDGLIPAVGPITKALTANVGSYTIGAGATFNIANPGRVYAAYIAVTGNRNEVKVVDAKTYFSHNDLAAAAGTPDEVYVDFNIDPATGFGTVKLWPIQTGTPTLELTVSQSFVAWTLGGAQFIAEGYQDAVEWALAWRLIPMFGPIVPQQIAETVMQEGQKAEQRLRQMNRANRQLQTGTEQLLPPGESPAPAAQR